VFNLLVVAMGNANEHHDFFTLLGEDFSKQWVPAIPLSYLTTEERALHCKRHTIQNLVLLNQIHPKMKRVNGYRFESPLPQVGELGILKTLNPFDGVFTKTVLGFIHTTNKIRKAISVDGDRIINTLASMSGSHASRTYPNSELLSKLDFGFLVSTYMNVEHAGDCIEAAITTHRDDPHILLPVFEILFKEYLKPNQYIVYKQTYSISTYTKPVVPKVGSLITL